MSLPRSIHHRASRKQLVREALYCYIVALAIFFLLVQFGKHYSLLSPSRTLTVSAAVRQAMLWALVGPFLWALQEYVLRGTELWKSYSSLDWQMQRLVLAGTVALVVATFLAWRWMLPVWGLSAAVALYLRFSRPKDSL